MGPLWPWAVVIGILACLGGLYVFIFHRQHRRIIPTLEVREEGLSLISDRGRLWVPMDDIEEITLVNKEADPLIDDVIWELFTRKGVKIEISNYIKGTRELLERFQRLPGFDNDAVIDSMSDLSPSKRLCWKRKA